MIFDCNCINHNARSKNNAFCIVSKHMDSRFIDCSDGPRQCSRKYAHWWCVMWHVYPSFCMKISLISILTPNCLASEWTLPHISGMKLSSFDDTSLQFPLEISFTWAEKGGWEKVGGCTWRMHTAWLSLGSALETPWLALGGPLLSSYANSPLTLYGTHFLQGSFFPSLDEWSLTESHAYCKLVNE